MRRDGVRDAAWHDALYTEHRERIMHVLIRMLNGDKAAAEDLTQETFVTAWKKRNSVPEDPVGWLVVVAKNHLRNFGRTQRRHRHVASVAGGWAIGAGRRPVVIVRRFADGIGGKGES